MRIDCVLFILESSGNGRVIPWWRLEQLEFVQEVLHKGIIFVDPGVSSVELYDVRHSGLTLRCSTICYVSCALAYSVSSIFL